MSLISRLAEKSWQTPGDAGLADPADYRPAAATVGLYVYLGVATVIFTLMTAAYLMRMAMPGAMDHGGGSDWQPMPEPPLLWINTGVLVASSLAWEVSRRSTHLGASERMRLMAMTGGLLGLGFLAGQLVLWRHYQAAGYYLAANPANAFFYMLTAAHGLHLAGGLVAGGRAIAQLGEQTDRARTIRNVRLCAVYWHFLLLVWIVLVGLLVLT
ncbi:MAG: heme-copper oxidase subunit III [Novosphingobium sp.]